MKALINKSKLLAAMSAGSFFCLVIFAAVTSPIVNAIYSVVFFALLLVFLTTTGYWLIKLRGRELTVRRKSKIIILAVFIVILLMFRSAGSLSLVDLLILILTTGGVLFYVDRR